MMAPIILTRISATLVATLILTVITRAAEIPKLSSPDGKFSVTLQAANGLTYAVHLDGAPLLVPSKLGLSFEGGLQLGENVQVLDAKIIANNTA